MNVLVRVFGKFVMFEMIIFHFIFSFEHATCHGGKQSLRDALLGVKSKRIEYQRLWC